ncbi:siderophore-interacting protein [Brucellaceae bacterium C25G]
MTPDYFAATVKYKEAISPSLMRVTLAGGNLHQFETTGKPDEFICLFFPSPDKDEGIGRYYTVRQWDPINYEMTIDFVLHETGIATHWARQVQEGENIKFRLPRFCFTPPSDVNYMILLTDITGLPAVGRALEELPEGFKVIAHIEIPVEADRQIIETKGDVSLNWHVFQNRENDNNAYTNLPQIAKCITNLPEGSGYIYIAGETRAVTECRKYFRDRFNLDKKSIDAIGYWNDGRVRS